MTNDVSPQLLLAFLNDAWTRAADGANKFREQLISDQTGALQLIKTGSVASVGKNSTNQSYAFYGAGVLTHVQIVETIGNLLALYDQVKLKITCAFQANADFDYTVPADFDFDQSVYDALTQLFTAQSTGVAQMLPDITRLRLPACGPLNPSGFAW